MKYIILSLLLCVIIYNSYIGSNSIHDNKIVESFSNDNNNNNIILLGDSIFKNNEFVGSKDSIESLLKLKAERSNVYVLATDRSKIKDIYKQINNIPERLNNSNSIIFLSVGGNDILMKNSNVDKIFTNYQELLNELKGKFNKSKLVVCNLYAPPMLKNIFINDKIIYKKIKEWNYKIYDYIKINNIELIKLDNILYEPNDFVSDYEPSKLGGEKIVNTIIQMTNY